MVLSFLKRYRLQLFLIASILVILYPLSLFIYIPKWDNVNGYLPYRYFISDYVWNGHLPLWNSFQRLGYLGYADLQSGAWSPIVWVIMLFGKYTINSLIVELLSCYVLAGLGMFRLAKSYFNHAQTGFILGLSYALSGFMVGSSQLMVFLIAVTWFPWICFYLLEFFKNYKLKNALLAAFFMALFITGASPAYTIILAYIVVGMFIYHMLVQRKESGAFKNIFIGGLMMLAMLVVLILPYINAFLEFAPYFNRADRLAYSSFLLSNPYTPISYISFLLPHGVIAKTDWFDITDLSLRNGYFGLIGFIGVLSAVWAKMTRRKFILMVLIVISLVLAAGGETFVFEYLYNLPGFGVFRHPSMFRAFTIFCLLLLAGEEIKVALTEGVAKRHKIAVIIVISVLAIVAGWALVKTDLTALWNLVVTNWNFQEFSESALSTHLLLNALISISLLFLGIVLVKFFRGSWGSALFVLLLLDLGIQTRLSIPTTVCYPIEQDQISTFFKELPNEIDQENVLKPLKELDETQPLNKTNGIWQNLSTYNKTLSYVGVNPMRFKSFDEAEKDGRLDKAIEHNIIYAVNESELKLKDIKVGYNEFSVEVTNTSESEQVLVLNQNYHHQWKAYFTNNEPLIVEPLNGFTMQVTVPEKAQGVVHYKFDSPRTWWLFIVSLLGYFGLVAYLLIGRKTNA